MANYTAEQWNAIKIELMEKCYNGFAELGLHGTGMREMAKYCGYNTSKIYTYFKDLDDLIIQSTEYCMSKVEDDFMAKMPKNVEDLWRFIDEIPYWTAKNMARSIDLCIKCILIQNTGSTVRSSLKVWISVIPSVPNY